MVQSSETFVEMAMVRLILKRLVRGEREPFKTRS